MKKIFIAFGITLGSILAVLYLSFLFLLPNILDLNKYESDITSLIKEQTNFNVSYKNPKIQTTPLLSVWLKLEDIKIDDKNSNNILELPKLKIRVSLPSIFLMTFKISALEAESPRVSLNITNGIQLDLLKQIEEIINNKKQNEEINNEPESIFNPSWIRIKVVNAKLNDYRITISDYKNKHTMLIQGEKFKADYFNGENFKVITNPQILLDDKTKVRADINFDCFIPKKPELDNEDDPAENFEISAINPVEIYRKFNVVSDLKTKLKIRNKKQGIWAKGLLDIDNLTFNLSDYSLPKSYIKAQFGGYSVLTDTNIALSKNEKISVSGKIKYGKKPDTDLKILTDKIYINTLIELLKSALDTFDVKNDFKNFKGDGYLLADANIITDLKSIKSKGKFIVENGTIINKQSGRVLAKINTDILFDDKDLQIKKIATDLGGRELNATGNISNASSVNIKLNTSDMSAAGLFNIFAPPSVKKMYSIEDGKIYANFTINGKLKDAVLSGSSGIKNLKLVSKDRSLLIQNKDLDFKINGNLKKFESVIVNEGFSITLPSLNSKIYSSKIEAEVNEDNIRTAPFDLNINSDSSINFIASAENYLKKPSVNIEGRGNLNADDLKRFLGKQAAPFVDAKGNLPVTFTYLTEKSKGNLNFQIEADNSNYITPVNIENMFGKKSLLKAHVIIKPNRMNIRDTGFYVKEITENSDGKIKEELKKIAEVSGTINDTETTPFINVIKIIIPDNLKLNIVNFKNSSLDFSGGLKIFGSSTSPNYKGEFNIDNISLPDILTDIKNIKLIFNEKNLNLSGSEIMLNGSDAKFETDLSLRPASFLILNNLKFLSVHTDLNRLLKTAELLNKKIPQTAGSGKKSNREEIIPAELRNGTFNIYKLTLDNIVLQDIKGNLSFKNNILSIEKLLASVFNGTVRGDVMMNPISSRLIVHVRGDNINAQKALLDLANIKDALSGTTSFDSDLTLNITDDYEKLVKSIAGNVNFALRNGQYGGFAKIENFILAENIRESQFFQTALGGIINSLATIDTTHFEELRGTINFDKGILHIIPITSKGNVITFKLFGDMDILKNETDMKLQGRLASAVSNLLGPLSAINPINILKKTPGLNIALAKTFSVFCESITQDKLDEIPVFSKEQTTSDATNFQIVLRGSLDKPLTLVKSFKWLALQEDIDGAFGFVSSLPEPEIIDSKGTVLQTKEEIDAYNAKVSTKIKKFVGRIFKR